MKGVGLQLALPAAIAVIGFSGRSIAEEKGAVPSAGDLQAKIQYCSTCHGASGQGYRGATPMPRLAGQQIEYLESQLLAFIERRRENKFMFGVAHVLSPQMRTALAKHFSALNPKPIGGAPQELLAAGKKIFDEGIPDASIPPCGSCHGPEAKGDGAFPRLAGQLFPYIQRALLNWSKVRGQDPAKPDNSAIMQPIAHSLTEAQVSALAAYLSSLE